MSEERADYNPSAGLMSLKGKAYLPVAERIVWFRNDYPEGQIETTLVEHDRQAGYAMYRARVSTGNGGVAEASGTETKQDFGDYLEKSETKSVGRALGYLGYGTANAGFEEGQRVVDAPRNTPTPRARPNDNLVPHEWRGRLDFDSDNPNAYRPKGQEIATTPRPTPQDAPKRRPPAEPLTEAQQEAVASAWDMATSDTYPAVLAMLRTVFPGATPGQLTALDDERRKIAAKHFPDAAIQKGQ